MATTRGIFISLAQPEGTPQPLFLPQLGTDSSLGGLWMEFLGVSGDGASTFATARLLFARELSLRIPGLDAVEIIVAPGTSDAAYSIVKIGVRIQPSLHVALSDVPVVLRLKTSLLRPARRVVAATSAKPDRFEIDATKSAIDIELARISMSVDGDGNIELTTTGGVTLPPTMIDGTGIVIEATGVQLYLDASQPPPGKPQGWRGLYMAQATLYLPGELAGSAGELSLTNAYIGNGGFSGAVSNTWTPPLATSLFGLEITLESVELTFVQNALTQSRISGRVTLPFFDDEVGVEIAIGRDGSLGIEVTDIDPLEIDQVLRLELDSLRIDVVDGKAKVKLSGDIVPIFGGLDWPKFHVNELSIDSKGNVELDGGWLNLPDQYHLDFHGFHIEITKLGFGQTEDGEKFIGLSGGVKLVDGMQAGASVEGLRLSWRDGDPDSIHITLDGVGLEFEVPKVVRFKGAVAYRQLPDPDHPNEKLHRFVGSIDLELLALDLTVAGNVVFGRAVGDDGPYTFMALYLDAEFPKGVPLFATGVALYGFAGLLAVQMVPDKRKDEAWYGMDTDHSWYHRGEDGIVDLDEKWINREGGYAFGAGVTIGTNADNGYAFHGRAMLAFAFPGPVAFLEGRCNLMKKRTSLTEEADFRALAVLDGNAGTLLIGLSAHYAYGAGGELIDITGGAEAFFSFHDASLWHLYLGQRDPQSLRIRASLARLFTANAYFMLDARSLALGAWIGWDKSWKFGPLSVSVAAWIEGNALISWRPTHLHGDLWLHGSAELAVFGFGAGLTVDARLEADVFDPFHILGDFKVSIGLPWPLPDFDVSVTLEWTSPPKAPGLPAPLQEASIEHFLSTSTWPLPRGSLLLPKVVDDDGLLISGVSYDPAAPPPSDAPIVPLDCRPSLAFARRVHDSAKVGINSQAVVPGFEEMGDTTRGDNPLYVRYSLEEVVLDAWRQGPGAWEAVARKGTDANVPATLPRLFGSWAPMPSMPNGTGTGVGHTKFILWSSTAFDYSLHTGGAWDEGFTDLLPDYPPCIPSAEIERCDDFADLDPDGVPALPWYSPDVPGLSLDWLAAPTVRTVAPPLEGLSRALCFPATASLPDSGPVPNEIRLALPKGAKRVSLLIADQTTRCVDFTGRVAQDLPNPYTELGATFTALTDGSPAPQNAIVVASALDGPLSGLDCQTELEVVLPQASSFVELLVTSASPPARIQAYRPDGSTIGAVTITEARQQTTARFTHGPVARVVIRADHVGTVLHRVCFDSTWPSPAVGIGYDAEDHPFGPFPVVDHVLDVVGTDLVRAVVTSPATTCLLRICVTKAATPESIEAFELSQHTIDQVSRLYETGNVLQPQTHYRLKIKTKVEAFPRQTLSDLPPNPLELTEYAYFRTEGPPGLARYSIPPNAANPGVLTLRDEDGKVIDAASGGPALKTELNTLAPYVRQTIPESVIAPGDKVALVRPVYRAYDVRTEFRVDYVDLMYRLARRDLGLYLFDRNNLPATDAAGRLFVLTNQWGATAQATLTEGEERWIVQIDAAGCTTVDHTKLTRDRTLTSAADGLVLEPNMRYEARLVPLLVHEDFSRSQDGDIANPPANAVERWQVVDVATGNSSDWRVKRPDPQSIAFIEQRSPMGDGTDDPTDLVKPGTFLKFTDDPSIADLDPSQPSLWTDYRLTVHVSSDTGGEIGVAFRYRSLENRHYLFVMHSELGYRRLMRVTNDIPQVLASDEVAYRKKRDYLITIAAVGTSLRVYVDGAPVFDVVDGVAGAIPQGTVAFHAWRNPGARFSDLRIDDFGGAAPVLYRFAFTTSEFANFFHQMHSYDDETWRVSPSQDPGLRAWFDRAAVPTVPPSAEESHAFELVADALLGAAARQDAPRLEVTRVELQGAAVAFLVRGSEPIHPARTSFDVSVATDTRTEAAVPGDLKLTDVTFGIADPADETVTVLARSALELTGHRVEALLPPGPLADPVGDPVLLLDRFEGPDSGLLHRETFGVGALAEYAIADRGPASHWEMSEGTSVVPRKIVSRVVPIPPPGPDPQPPPPESFAVLRASRAWPHVRIAASLTSAGVDAFGLACRYQSPENGYLLRLDQANSHRQFVKRVAGQDEVLWEDDQAYVSDQAYELILDVYGSQFVGSIDEVVLFHVEDHQFLVGSTGFWTTLTNKLFVDAFSVEARESAPVLADPRFVDLTEVVITDAPSSVDGPSAWSAADGVLSQTSFIRRSDPFGQDLATIAELRGSDWGDVEVSVRFEVTVPDVFGPEGLGAMGVALRRQASGDGYRFTIDFGLGERRLLKVIGGTSSVIWTETVPMLEGNGSILTLRAEGDRLQGFLDGSPLFDKIDGTFVRGRVGVFTAGCGSAHFGDLIVVDRTRRAGQWTLVDEAQDHRPSTWRLRHRALAQTSEIGGDLTPPWPGALAVAGELAWRDYRFAVRMASRNPAPIGLVFRYSDPEHYYRLATEPVTGRMSLVARTPAGVAELWEMVRTVVPDAPFTLMVDVIGDRLVGHHDGDLLFDVSNPALAAGQIGLYCAGNPGARFESIEVRQVPRELRAWLDLRFDGDVPGDWSSQGAGTRQIAPGPDRTDFVWSARKGASSSGSMGLVLRYQDELHYYQLELSVDGGPRRLFKRDGGGEVPLWHDDAGADLRPSMEVSVSMMGGTLRGFLDGVPMFVVEDTSLASGRVGLWANDQQFGDHFVSVRGLPAEDQFADWLLDDPFDFLEAGRWTFVDAGDQNGPSEWNVDDGEMVQTSAISGGIAGQADAPGTLALAGDVDWTDYRLSVRLHTDGDGAIGVLARYRDADHHYLFVLERAGTTGRRRLIKKVGTTVSILHEDQTLPILGREYVVTMDCFGKNLRVYVDGDTWCDVIDADLATGRVGLYCWQNPMAHWAEVRVAAPVWSTYHRFVEDDPVPAGTRIVMTPAGAPETPPPPVSGLLRRFLAPSGSPGWLRLPRDAASLRVVTPDGVPGPPRRFLPSFDSVPDVRVLRKADATAFVLLIPDATVSTGSRLDPGTYRFHWCYRRDNQDRDPASPVLRQAGDDSTEHVTLDVPWNTR
jgi:hypothetical protein